MNEAYSAMGQIKSWTENWKIVMACFITAIFFLVLYKSIHVPMTHDETPVVTRYSHYTYWEIMMFPDNWPTNHILNTLLVKSILPFGSEVWMVRLPNLVSFFILILGGIRISNCFFGKSHFLKFCFTVFLLANPYFLDFFGLCRGYGIASALVTLASSYLLTGYRYRKSQHLWWGFLLAMAASYANFTALIFWVTSGMLSGLYFLLQDKPYKKVPHLVGLFISGVAYLALIYSPIEKMSTTDQFKYWSSKGFYEETIQSMVEKGWYGKEEAFLGYEVVAELVLVTIILSLFFSIYYLVHHRKRNPVHNISELTPIFLLIVTIGVNVLQTTILNTPNLNGRTALFYYPLFCIVLGNFISKLYSIVRPEVVNLFAGLLAVYALVHLYQTYKPDYVREWWYDANTWEVINYLEVAKTGDSATLKTDWLFGPSFGYYVRTGKAPHVKLKPYDKELRVDTTVHFYYVTEADTSKLSPYFELVERFGWDRWLMRRTLAPSKPEKN